MTNETVYQDITDFDKSVAEDNIKIPCLASVDKEHYASKHDIPEHFIKNHIMTRYEAAIRGRSVKQHAEIILGSLGGLSYLETAQFFNEVFNFDFN